MMFLSLFSCFSWCIVKFKIYRCLLVVRLSYVENIVSENSCY